MALNREQMIQEMKLADMREQLKQDDLKQSRNQEVDVYNKNEMPEWLDSGDRTVVKNLSNNKDESLKYLQSKYPDAEFTHNGDEIFARKQGERGYKTLDPEFSPFSNPIGTIKDLWNDTKDLAYDGAQMAAEGAGAVAGGVAGLGVGSLPAAMAGGAAGGAVASTAKEALRKHFGLSDEMNFKDIASDTAMAGLMPGAFNVAGKGLKWGAKKAIPSLYAKATGVPLERLRLMSDKSSVMNPKTGKVFASKGDEIASMSDDVALSKMEGVGSTLDDGFQKNLDDVSQMYSNADAGAPNVSMKDSISYIDNEIASLRDLVARNPGVASFQKKLDDAIAFRGEVFSDNTSPLSMNIKDSMGLNDTLSKMTSYGDDAIGTGMSETKEKLAKELQRRNKAAIINSAPDRVGADTKFKGLLEEQDFIKRYFGGSDKVQTSKKIQSSLKNLGTGKDTVLDGGFQRLPKEVQEQIMKLKNELDTHTYLSGLNKNRVIKEGELGSAMVNNIVGKSPLERTLTALGTGIGYTTGGNVAAVIGAGAGRGVGKLIASPRSVKATAKIGRKAGRGMDSIESLIKNNPELQALIYGSAYAGSTK